MKSSEATQESEQNKKPYRAPLLVEYGSITDLTRAGVGPSGEGVTGSSLVKMT